MFNLFSKQNILKITLDGQIIEIQLKTLKTIEIIITKGKFKTFNGIVDSIVFYTKDDVDVMEHFLEGYIFAGVDGRGFHLVKKSELERVQAA